MLLPLIPELPEGPAAVASDPDADLAVDLGGDARGAETTLLLLENQAKIAGDYPHGAHSTG